MVDVRSGTQNGACWQDDDNASGQHAAFGKARAALMRVSTLLQGWAARAVEQLNATTVWNSFATISNASSPQSGCPKATYSSQIMRMESGNCVF